MLKIYIIFYLFFLKFLKNKQIINLLFIIYLNLLQDFHLIQRYSTKKNLKTDFFLFTDKQLIAIIIKNQVKQT